MSIAYQPDVPVPRVEDNSLHIETESNETPETDTRGGWVFGVAGRPTVSWIGGQENFPGGWLELGSEKIMNYKCRDPHVLSWNAIRKTYEPTGEKLLFEPLSLDMSHETNKVAEEVKSWGAEMEKNTQFNPDHKLYTSIASTLSEKLLKDESQVKQDYASEIYAIRHNKKLVGVIDCYVRDKTRSLILKYAISNPNSQFIHSYRSEGAIGGLGQACLNHLISRAQRERFRNLRMEALSLKLYTSAIYQGFEQIASGLPPFPKHSLDEIHDSSYKDV
eukprot:CAMPEP_0196576418 /NCGR_PEP_ID=MMETSP1081-20130531/5682_1 /TAXON_ID=36882 /ORGANISM="Pyramimonas amylifera, Strain CCMP720" /LENGTH=275 /DNA_ID=CAMNT_0041895015 /DNA_START=26 /DNA_END=853 /DNA_ORIENTATION=-